MNLNNPYLTWIRIVQFPIAIAVYIFFALVPDPQSYIPANYSDLVLHALGNCLFLISAWLTFVKRSHAILTALIIALPFSLLIEVSQGLTTTRTPDLKDLLANFAGIVVGVILCGIARKLLEEKETL